MNLKRLFEKFKFLTVFFKCVNRKYLPAFFEFEFEFKKIVEKQHIFFQR